MTSINSFSVKGILIRFKFKVMLTFLLLLGENILKVITPFMMGLAINDMLTGVYRGLFYLTGVYTLFLVIGVLRRMYDTRVYSSIYAVMASETVEIQKAENVNDSAVVTRSNLVKEFLDFFENDLTQGFSSFVTICGAAVMLAVFDIKIFAGCTVAVIIISLVYVFTEKRIYSLNHSLNDEMEKQVDIICNKNQPVVVKHFRSIARWNIRLSDMESWNFGFIEFVLLGLVVASLFVAVNSVNVTLGGIFSTLSYVLEFAEGVMWIPYIYQQFTRLKEITVRLAG